MESLADLGDLLGALRGAGLLDAVWAVAGGCPAAYSHLRATWICKGRDTVLAVDGWIAHMLRRAVHDVRYAAEIDERLAPLYGCFASTDAVPLSDLRAMGVSLSDRDRVLRTVYRDCQAWLVPADPAVALVMRWKLTEVPPLDALKAMGTSMTSAAAIE